MKKLLLALVAVSLLASGEGLSQSPRKQAFKRVMTQKLQSSQHLLEALALADFKKMKASAEKLLELTNTEEWLAIKTRQYAVHTNEFRSDLEKMLKKTKEKNLDGAALAYVELTLTCVRCHQYVREVRDARWDE